MQKNNQQYKQFLREFGALLTTHTRHGHAVQQQQTLKYLAEHVSSARRHHHLSRAMLAQKTGKGEAEIHALELGVLPYGELDLRFLRKLAAALDEDLETLLLLLGRPDLAHALQRQEVGHGVRTRTSLHNHLARRNSSALGEGATEPQPGDNVLPFAWVANLLHKGYLNLIDSVQEGRLFAHVRNSQRAWAPIAIFVCLLCIWVGTYSFSGYFDAKSTAQLDSIASAQTAVPPSVGLPSELSDGFATPVTFVLSAHNRPSLAGATAHALEDDLGTPNAMWVSALASDVQLCDSRTMGKFALCRV